MGPPHASTTAQLETVRAHIDGGSTWRQAAAAAGISSAGAAWRRATALWPALKGRRPRLTAAKREAIEAAVLASAHSYREIARREGVSPDTVSRLARAMVDQECEAEGLEAFSGARRYLCPGCRRSITTRPCVYCLGQLAKEGSPRHA